MPLTRDNEWSREGRVIRGSWRLTRRHELQYVRRGTREEIVLSGPITGAAPNGLSFRVEQQSSDESVLRRIWTLRGRWRADARNRLGFWVDRRQGGPDALTLQGSWELGPAQQILYRVEREDSHSGTRTIRLLRFEGYWEVGQDRRLVYVLDRSSDSGFRFSGSFQTASILAKRGEIRYQLGAEIQPGSRARILTLFGKWKASDRLGLSFEIPYGERKVRGIDFGVSYRIDALGQVQCQLRTRQGKLLGVELTLTRSFLKQQGEAFVRLRRSLEETAVEGGVRLRW